jgi:hypothetical protein
MIVATYNLDFKLSSRWTSKVSYINAHLLQLMLSLYTFSTDGPKICLRNPNILVFFPAPEGPYIKI